jgi:hypothetical protein
MRQGTRGNLFLNEKCAFDNIKTVRIVRVIRFEVFLYGVLSGLVSNVIPGRFNIFLFIFSPFETNRNMRFNRFIN